jgi:hypothetical protein
MAREIEWVTPAEMFTNWAELPQSAKKLLEEAQYRKQLYCSTYGD